MAGSMLETTLDTLAEAGDFLGLGNLFLEVLMRPHQELKPDADALLLHDRAPGLLRQQFGIPPRISYPSVYRDQHLASADRNVWAKDGKPHESSTTARQAAQILPPDGGGAADLPGDVEQNLPAARCAGRPDL